MAEWQKDELQNEDELEVVVGMTENNNMTDPEPVDLLSWQAEIDLDCTMLADPGMAVLDTYIEGNPDHEIMNAVTVLIDKSMTIRRVRGEDEPDITIEEIKALLAE